VAQTPDLATQNLGNDVPLESIGIPIL